MCVSAIHETDDDSTPADRSVDRNRLKRLAREAFRRHAAKTAGLDLVLAMRGPVERDGEAAWLAQCQELLARAAGAP